MSVGLKEVKTKSPVRLLAQGRESQRGMQIQKKNCVSVLRVRKSRNSLSTSGFLKGPQRICTPHDCFWFVKSYARREIRLALFFSRQPWIHTEPGRFLSV